MSEDSTVSLKYYGIHALFLEKKTGNQKWRSLLPKGERTSDQLTDAEDNAVEQVKSKKGKRQKRKGWPKKGARKYDDRHRSRPFRCDECGRSPSSPPSGHPP